VNLDISYFDLASVNQFLRLPFSFSTFSIRAICALGAGIAWKINRRRIDLDALTEHFKEIKDDVIKPLVHGMTTLSYYHLPSLHALHNDELKSTILRYIYLDIELGRDFLDNHYPEIIPLWNKIAQSGEDIDSKMYLLTKFIYQRISAECSSSGIEYRSSKLYTTSGTNGIPIVEFSDSLKNLILADSYHESRLYVDSKPSQNWICIDADMPYGHGIYFSSDENRIHEVLPQIRRICNTINNEVADEIAQYRILNNTIDRSLREFQRKLNIILYKTKLPLKKERLFIVKCRFIKADLE